MIFQDLAWKCPLKSLKNILCRKAEPTLLILIKPFNWLHFVSFLMLPAFLIKLWPSLLIFFFFISVGQNFNSQGWTMSKNGLFSLFRAIFEHVCGSYRVILSSKLKNKYNVKFLWDGPTAGFHPIEPESLKVRYWTTTNLESQGPWLKVHDFRQTQYLKPHFSQRAASASDGA